MVWFVDSTDIRIQDVEIANAPYWSCFVLNCTRVGIHGCYVHTERRRYHTFNGDGIDCSLSTSCNAIRNIRISDVRIADAVFFLKMHHMWSREALFRDITFFGISGTVKERARIYANKNRPFEKILFERCDINGGVEVVNADVTFKDGTLAALPLTDEQKAKINKAIEERKCLLY